MKPRARGLSLAVLPGTRNRIRLQPKVVACWAVGDGVFGFGHKFVGADAREDFVRFGRIRANHPHASIALFGHTDAVGSEAYNHQLGYERALAVFAVLRHDPDLWYELFRNDREGLALLKEELARRGPTIHDPAGSFGPSTLEAVREHLRRIGPDEPLQIADFLSAGQAALQSCSEFNPVLVPAPWMFDLLRDDQDIALQTVNRRVVALFFDPATVTNLRWPCPPAGEGPRPLQGAVLERRLDRRRTARAGVAVVAASLRWQPAPAVGSIRADVPMPLLPAVGRWPPMREGPSAGRRRARTTRARTGATTATTAASP